jgi:hypothetical protein
MCHPLYPSSRIRWVILFEGAIYPATSRPSRQKLTRPRAELALFRAIGPAGPSAAGGTVGSFRRVGPPNWVCLCTRASPQTGVVLRVCPRPSPRQPRSGRRNWLCFVDALIRVIHHNAFRTKYLSRPLPRGDWLCFARLPPAGWHRQGLRPWRWSSLSIGGRLGLFGATDLRTAGDRTGRRRSSSALPNWLCFVEPVMRAIHHNLFLTKYLPRLSLCGDWLCFARMARVKA